jgi:hypothetical protein
MIFVMVFLIFNQQFVRDKLFWSITLLRLRDINSPSINYDIPFNLNFL